MLRKLICKLIGHSWRYKHYDLILRLSNDKDDFTKSRRCNCCKTREVLTKNKEWVTRKSYIPKS
jgi:hypothetical protein